MPVSLRLGSAASVLLLLGAVIVGGAAAAASEGALPWLNTARLLRRAPHPPAGGAVPGIPFLPTARAKELIAIDGLH